MNLDLCLPCPHLEGQPPHCTVSKATLLPGRRKRDYSFHGNPVNTSTTQREFPQDMGSRLDPEQGASTKGKLRKLLLLARSRPHPRTSWNQERRWANYRGRPELPQRAQGGFTRQSPRRQLGVSLELVPSYVVTYPETLTAVPLKWSRSGRRGEGQVLGAAPFTPATFEAGSHHSKGLPDLTGQELTLTCPS